MGLGDGRVVIVTGGGRGLGRSHALALGAAGAAVVVNDVGTETSHGGATTRVAELVAEEIVAAGGTAVANADDIATEDGAGALVDAALRSFGRLDAVVNNAGILRDSMLVNMDFAAWDAVMHVHLRGTFAVTRAAASHWRDLTKRGTEVDARVVNTSSASGLFGNVGQANYAAAKAGIAAFTIVASAELRRYGVTVNAIAPAARTRMTEDLPSLAEIMNPVEGAFDAMSSDNVSPLIVWLAGPSSAAVTGRVFEVAGGHIGVLNGWSRGPAVDRAGRWEPEELEEIVGQLVSEAPRPTRAFPIPGMLPVA